MKPARIEQLTREDQKLLIRRTLLRERGRRPDIHTIVKWWGRRFSTLAGELIRLANPPRGGLILDPYTGGGTLLAEAVLGGYRAYGIDIDPAAVMVARMSLKALTANCEDMVECLVRRLEYAEENAGHLWRLPSGWRILHVFLARIDGSGACSVPVLLYMDRYRRSCIVVGEDGGLREAPPGECGLLKPTSPRVSLDKNKLSIINDKYCAYAVELYKPYGSRVSRRFYSITRNPILKNFLDKTNETALEILRDKGVSCTPIPLSEETRRLHRNKVYCWENLYTPRQLAVLKLFTDESLGDCLEEAKLIAASQTRTLSLLAFYYQVYGKVNPGLVVKSYWLPRFPVELNPLARLPSRKGPARSLGRGTLASPIRRLWRACESRSSRWSMGWGWIRLGDARLSLSYPLYADLVLTDPPYPGVQSYGDLGLVYRYWLGVQDVHVNDPDTIDIIEGLVHAARRLRSNGYMIVYMGSSSFSVDPMVEVFSALASSRLLGLRRIYWFPGEPPGLLGRSRVRGVFVAVYRRGSFTRGDSLEPLLWVRDLAVEANRVVNRGRGRYLDPFVEEARARDLVSGLMSVLDLKI